MFITSIVSAQEYVKYDAGTEFELYTIPKCEGIVSIKITSEEGITSDELSINDCSQLNNYSWRCSCDDTFTVMINSLNKTHNIYDFTIKYLVDSVNSQVSGSRQPSLSEIKYDNSIRTHKIIDVLIVPVKQIKLPFELNIESKNAMMFAVGLFIFITIIILFKGKKYIISSGKKNYDVMNYRTKNDDVDIEDIFNKIK